MPAIASITILNDERLLEGLLCLIDSISKKLGFLHSKELKIRMACEEIISERIKNAYAGEGFIGIDIILTDEAFEISVHDKGIPYWKNANAYDPRHIDENASGLEDFLIANLADFSGSEKLGKNGQRTFARFALPLPLSLKPREIKECVPKDFDITIREIRDNYDDIISAITCIYDEYQYSYGYERLYYPENFKQLVQDGKLRSFIAVNAHGETAGHYALSFSDDYPNMPEWCSVFVRHPFRRRHIFENMLEHGMETAEKMGMKALMVQPTAYHTATQKICLRNGFTATGFLFQYVNSDMLSEYNTDGRRLDLAVCVKPLREDTDVLGKTVYLPEEHAEFLKVMYGRLGAKRVFAAEEYDSERHTDLKYEMNALLKSGRLVVSQAGGSFETELNQVVRNMRKNKMEMAEMLINIGDPAAPFAYRKATESGFIFTGLVPLGESGDYLLMQNLFGAETDKEVLTTIGEFADLLDYIC